MTPEQLRNLAASGESLDVEFKSDSNRTFSDHELAKAIACLANRASSEPGLLIIGVEKEGNITGARPRHENGTTDCRRLEATIANLTHPHHSTRAEIVPIDDLEVLAIEVPSSSVPVASPDGYFAHRVLDAHGNPACIPFQFHELTARSASFGVHDYSMLPFPELDFDALDPIEFDRFRHAIRENEPHSDLQLLKLDNVQLATVLGAVKQANEHITVLALGLLLFGRPEVLRTQIPTHEIAFQVESDTKVRVNDTIRLPLLHALEEIEARFRARNEEQEVFVGMTRVGVPNYSGRAFREAVVNALTHRDYTMNGSVNVHWSDRRLVISNPGSFPVGVHLYNLLSADPHPRNRLLADALKRAGIVERIGRGIDTIYAGQIRIGRPPPSYSRSTSTRVILDLRRGEANLGLVHMIAEQGQTGPEFTSQELLLLRALVTGGGLKLSDAIDIIQTDEGDAEECLQHLIAMGMAETKGSNSRLVYQLSRTARRHIDEFSPPDSLRTVPVPNDKLVLQLITEHGPISRGEVMEACSLSKVQAYRLLKKMEANGRIRRIGKRGRGVRYDQKS